MTTLQTNIDDVRAEIMRLESAPIFDAMAWSRVLAAMSDRPAGLADAKRRMETAMGNQVTVGIDLANGPNDCVAHICWPRYTSSFSQMISVGIFAMYLPSKYWPAEVLFQVRRTRSRRAIMCVLLHSRRQASVIKDLSPAVKIKNPRLGCLTGSHYCTDYSFAVVYSAGYDAGNIRLLRFPSKPCPLGGACADLLCETQAPNQWRSGAYQNGFAARCDLFPVHFKAFLPELRECGF